MKFYVVYFDSWSEEQHGRYVPLGSSCYPRAISEDLDTAKKIANKLLTTSENLFVGSVWIAEWDTADFDSPIKKYDPKKIYYKGRRIVFIDEKDSWKVEITVNTDDGVVTTTIPVNGSEETYE